MGWEYLVLLAISLLISILLAPKPPKPQHTEIQEGEVPTATENKPIPVVFGEMIIKQSNVTWWGDIYADAIWSKAGKKGGSKTELQSEKDQRAAAQARQAEERQKKAEEESTFENTDNIR